MRAAQFFWALLLVCPVGPIGLAACGAEPQVALTLASGRDFSGVIDAASNAEQLVLRSDDSGITIRRTIAWDRIKRATIDGQSVNGAKLLEDVIARKVTAPAEPRNLLRKIDLRDPPSTESKFVEVDSLPPRVAMVAFDAYVANWDADLETDGLVLDIAPLDLDRRLIAASGTLEVELFAQQRRKLELAPQSGGST